MKKIFFVSIIILCVFVAKSQVSVDEATKKIVYQEVIPMQGSKDTLYARAMAWVNSYFKNPQSVTTIRDPEGGIILCAHRMVIQDADKEGRLVNSSVLVEFKLKIEAKQERYRYTVNEFRKKAASMFPLERWLDKKDPQYTSQCDIYLAQVDANIKSMIESLKKGMEPKVIKNDDW